MGDCAIKLFGKRILPLERDDEKTNYNTTSQDDKLQKDPCTPLQSENPKPSNSQEESISNNSNSKTDNDNSPPKKPDKILPCPRCKSMDTKFCYYNNYNINQPRHFCKNCQRYWTAGGSMRNVPVGAGRRKSKNNFASLNGSLFYPNIPVNPVIKSNNSGSMVLSFGDENSSVSSPEGSKCKDEEKNNKSNLEGSSCINGNGSSTNALPYMWGPVPVYNGLNGSNFGVQFYPYWGFVPVPFNSGGVCTGSGILGKHSREEIVPNCREGENNNNNNNNNNIWVPKTLRIDNPEEAAKSSIWAMVQSEKSEKFGGKIAKMFEGRGEMKESNNNGFNSKILNSNPAALARSGNFHENV